MTNDKPSQPINLGLLKMLKTADDKATERAAIRRLLMYWGNAERERKNIAERMVETEQELEALYDIHPTQLTGLPHGGNVSDPTEETAMRNIKRAEALKRYKDHLSREWDTLNYRAGYIKEAVMTLPQLEYEVIYLRYVRFGVATAGYWSKIAKRVNVSEDHAKTLERNGVDRLIKMIEFSE